MSCWAALFGRSLAAWTGTMVTSLENSFQRLQGEVTLELFVVPARAETQAGGEPAGSEPDAEATPHEPRLGGAGQELDLASAPTWPTAAAR